jgi:hypothetical protein
VRTIELTVASGRTDDLLGELRPLQPMTLRLQRGASLQPPGDVIAMEVANETLVDVMRIADRYGLGHGAGVTMTTSVPLSIVTSSYSALTREPGATTWEELELSIGEDSTMTGDRVVVMGIAGIITGLGIATGTLHAVIGAMVIAPGFQPFARFVLGLINRSGAWRGGLTDVLRAYGALIVGATVAAVLCLVFGEGALDAGADSYLTPDALITFWSTPSWAGLTTSAVAAVCGGLLVSLNRTVLTAGVMVALALVPTAALVPMALVGGDLVLAGQALARFLVEVALVLGGSAVVFTYKRRRDGRRAVD